MTGSFRIQFSEFGTPDASKVGGKSGPRRDVAESEQSTGEFGLVGKHSFVQVVTLRE
jgi:hypothetical protein